jgi:hypothetical protein
VQPLGRDESDELALELLARPPSRVPPISGCSARLFDRSGGNPLFLQELAVLVAAEGPTSELPDHCAP